MPLRPRDPEAGFRSFEQDHIPGARYAHLDHHLSSPRSPVTGRHPLPETSRWRQQLGAWGIGPHTQVVAYDDCGGLFAARMWWLLRWMGHQPAAVLDGGLDEWQRNGNPLTRDIDPPVAIDYPAIIANPDLWLGTARVEQIVLEQKQDWRIVDARGPARFLGREESIDPVAGHIPGAVNLPCQDNLDGRKQFLPSAQLRERFTRTLAGLDPKRVVHTCGSGVSACHNVLAMEIAGLSGSRLYPGSWSEWITDPKRPIATTTG